MPDLLTSYGTGLAALVGLSVAWVWVQRSWQRIVPDDRGDPDVLANRCGCLGCRDTAVCNRGTSGEGT